MPLTSIEIMNGLQIAVFVMLIIVLYHVLFVVVDLRKVLRRIEDLTSQIEDVIMKPLSVADHLLQWTVDLVEEQHGKLDKGKKKSKKPKK
ncbi:MAG: hypothetical protein O2904_04175 [bacterium]|nr:hypothetical protein [bacterium]